MVSKNDMEVFKNAINDSFKQSIDNVCDKYDKKFEETDKAIGELRALLKDVQVQVEGAQVQDGNDSASKRLRSLEPRSASVGRRGSQNRHDGVKTIKDEVRAKLERRVTASGFLNNSTKEFRENIINAFLAELGTMSNYGEYSVFAKGVTGSDVAIEFTSKEVANQFIKDNLAKIKDFEVDGKNGVKRRTFFNNYMDAAQHKVYHATRLLADGMTKSKLFEPLTIKAMKYKGVVSIDDFDVLKVGYNQDGDVEYKILKRNVDDLSVESVLANLEASIEAFKTRFQ